MTSRLRSIAYASFNQSIKSLCRVFVCVITGKSRGGWRLYVGEIARWRVGEILTLALTPPLALALALALTLAPGKGGAAHREQEQEQEQEEEEERSYTLRSATHWTAKRATCR